MAVTAQLDDHEPVLVACHDAGLTNAIRTQLARNAIAIRDLRTNAHLTDARFLRGARVVVLELMQYDALSAIASLRNVSNVPLIAILDAQRTVDPVDVLDAGADDFILNPCAPRDVAAKIRAWLRRMTDEPLHSGPSDYGPLQLDVSAREIRKHGQLLAVPPREFDLFAFLAQRPRHAFSRHELLEHVWSASDHWLGPATVTEHVRRLRQRIEDDPARPHFVRTVRGFGYRFEPVANR